MSDSREGNVNEVYGLKESEALAGKTFLEIEKDFTTYWNVLSLWMYKIAQSKGFNNHGNKAERIALMHSELSEALEALRHNDPPDDKIPEFTGQEAELADCIIRIMDYSYANSLRVGEAVVAKMKYNIKREHMHGGKAF